MPKGTKKDDSNGTETKTDATPSLQAAIPTGEIKRKDLISPILSSLDPDSTSDKEVERDDKIRAYLTQLFSKHPIADSYNVLIQYDEGRMVRSDTDYIYSAAASFIDKKPILLVLYSTGGVIESAYLIGKLCREYSSNRFCVVVPRLAKSAATLICCAADEIHMGSLSELGPIDPQIDDMPALGLKATVEHIAALMMSHPYAADMFAKYLKYSLNPVQIGYYERIGESACQYAERLLRSHETNLSQPPEKIARDLVYTYKDHGFVIDKAEATTVFGAQVVKQNTPEYSFGNELYGSLIFISRVADIKDHNFYFIGSKDTKPTFVKRKKRR